MKHLISAICQQLRAGRPAVLCTILESHGSTPREAGAHMAVLSDGSTLDTVGGGALEAQAIRRAGELLPLKRSEAKEYLLHPNSQEDLGMVCGGSALLGFQCFLPDRDLPLLEHLEQVLFAGEPGWLRTLYRPDGSAELTLLPGEDLHLDAPRLPLVPTVEETASGLLFLEPLEKQPRALIYGGGHVGRALCAVLSLTGFAVTVCDPRREMADPLRFPGAEQVICAPFAPLPVLPGPGDYAAVMTSGHKADHTVLRQLLPTPAGYIGCIGSKRKVAYVNDLLREEGFSREDLARIHAPIGLSIGAQTPEEIAVSIAAEMIRIRRTGE